jgi:hypothetical protein
MDPYFESKMTYVWLDGPVGNPRYPCTGPWKGKHHTTVTLHPSSVSTPKAVPKKPTRPEVVHFEVSCGACDACFTGYNDLCKDKRWF